MASHYNEIIRRLATLDERISGLSKTLDSINSVLTERRLAWDAATVKADLIILVLLSGVAGFAFIYLVKRLVS